MAGPGSPEPPPRRWRGVRHAESASSAASEDPVLNMISAISRKNPDFWDDFFAGPEGYDPVAMHQSDCQALRRSGTARLDTLRRSGTARLPPARSFCASASPAVAAPGSSPGLTPSDSALKVVRQVSQIERTRCTLGGYACSCCAVAASTSVAAILLWSDIGVGGEVVGVGHEVVLWLETHEFLRTYTLGAGSIILAALSLFDFFSPPHLPGSTRKLWEGDTCVGPCFLALAIMCFIASGFLSAKGLPSVPLLMTVGLSPMSVYMIRRVTRPARIAQQTKDSVVVSENMAAKMALLAAISEREEDLISFMRGGRAGFLLSFSLSFAWWLYWAIHTHQMGHYDRRKDGFGLDLELSKEEEELEYFLWATPIVVSCSSLLFAVFINLRLVMHDTYVITDHVKNQLIASAMDAWESPEMSEKAKDMVKGCVSHIGAGDRHIEQAEQAAVEQMSKMMKATCCVFIFIFGMFYIAGQLLYTDMKVAVTFVALVVIFFITFIVFTYKSFKRIFPYMGRRMAEHPVGRMLHGVAAASWSRAFLFTFLPLVPCIIVMSWANQMIRRARRLYKRIPIETEENDPEWKEWSSCMSDLAALPLTPRVYFVLAHVWENWPWLQIFPIVYTFCGVYLCYAICPVLLNVLLAWLSKVLSGWPFQVIILVVFFTGIGAFLIPWVPGLTVYIFGGLVLSNSCPWGADPTTRFWVGALVNIAVSWALKLVACAVQQKCIGELLGKSLSVRRTVGVHKPMIRCIEAELRQPGWSIGKVAILCGGPDWPTSVLAGVLRLSLWQCELGTVPIVFFVIPCALTGSFYLKKSESPIWSRAANLMTLFSLMVSMLLWALALWAIQDRLEKDHFELERPLPQNAELEWLEFRDAEVARRCALVWADLPRLTRWTFAFGAVVHVLVCHVLCWMNESLFGTFNVSDDIDTLKWYGSDGGLFNVWSVATLAVYCAALLAYFQYSAWHKLSQSGARRRASREVEAQKDAWLQDYHKRCREALDGRGRAPGATPPEPHRAEKPDGDAVCGSAVDAASPRTPPTRGPRGVGLDGGSPGFLSSSGAGPGGSPPGPTGGPAGGGPGDEQEEEGGRAWGPQSSALWGAACDSEPVALAAGEPCAWAGVEAAAAADAPGAAKAPGPPAATGSILPLKDHLCYDEVPAAADSAPPLGGSPAAADAVLPPSMASAGTPVFGLASSRLAPLSGGTWTTEQDGDAVAACSTVAAAADESATQPLHQAGGRPAPLPRCLRLQARWRGGGGGSLAKDAAVANVPPTALLEAGGESLELALEPAPDLSPPAPLAPTPPSSPPASPTVLMRALTLVDRRPAHHRAEPWNELGRLYRL